MAIVSGASKYQWMDPKLGTTSTSQGGSLMVPPFGATQWAPGTVYAAKASVVNGAFLFNTSAGGTSASAVAVGPTPNGLTDNSVTWTLGGPIGGPCNIDATAVQEIGYMALAKDVGPNNFGVGQFMYVAFTGTTVPGDLVLVDAYNATGAQAARSARGSIGISMGAGASGKFGWVMIQGIHDSINAKNGASTINTVLYAFTTAGQCATTSNATDGIGGMVLKVTGDAQNRGAGVVYWPSMTGNP